MKNFTYLILITVLLLSACGRPDVDEETGQKTIRIAYLVNPTQSSHLVLKDFKAQVEEKSDENLQVELYTSGTIFSSDHEAIEAVQQRNVEMTHLALPIV